MPRAKKTAAETQTLPKIVRAVSPPHYEYSEIRLESRTVLDRMLADRIQKGGAFEVSITREKGAPYYLVEFTQDKVRRQWEVPLSAALAAKRCTPTSKS